jgi:hypothetical protein
MRKVELKVIRPWVAKKVVELVGFEDEVVIEYAMGLLEDESQPVRCVPFTATARQTADILMCSHQTLRKCRST